MSETIINMIEKAGSVFIGIVDDDLSVSMVLRSILEREGCPQLSPQTLRSR